MFTLATKREWIRQAKADPARIESLIDTLNHSNRLVRQQARYALIEIGEAAVTPLIKALDIRNDQIHWQVTKALRQIASPKSIEALVGLLQDDEMGIRWIASEGLIAIGRKSLDPLLQALIHQSDSFSLRESTHHILNDLLYHSRRLDRTTKTIIYPVLEALESIEPAVSVPVAAYKALQFLNQESPWSEV